MGGRGLAIGGAVTAGVVALAATLVLLLGGGPAVADCYSGSGATPEGQQFEATLRLSLDGDLVSGTYTAAGVAFDVSGTLDGDRFDGTFTAAGVRTPATGTITAERASFDSGRRGDGRQPVDFRAGC